MIEFKSKYIIYPGTDTIDAMKVVLKKIDLSISACVYIEFKKQYYAVFYEDILTTIVVGKELVFYNRNGIFECSPITLFKKPYNIKVRNEKSESKIIKKTTSPQDDNVEVYGITFVDEMLEMYRDLQVYGHKGNLNQQLFNFTNKLFVLRYISILASTFCNQFYDRKSIYKVQPYFKFAIDIVQFFFKNEQFVEIDPFRQIIKFPYGIEKRYISILKKDRTIDKYNTSFIVIDELVNLVE